MCLTYCIYTISVHEEVFSFLFLPLVTPDMHHPFLPKISNVPHGSHFYIRVLYSSFKNVSQSKRLSVCINTATTHV